MRCTTLLSFCLIISSTSSIYTSPKYPRRAMRQGAFSAINSCCCNVCQRVSGQEYPPYDTCNQCVAMSFFAVQLALIKVYDASTFFVHRVKEGATIIKEACCPIQDHQRR